MRNSNDKKQQALLVFIFTLVVGFCYLPKAEAQLEVPHGVAMWNTHLGMVNILELSNLSEEELPLEVIVFDQNGVQIDNETYYLAPFTQQDIILNDTLLRNHNNEIGTLYLINEDRSPYEGIVGGRLTFYRWNLMGNEVEFSFSVPIEIFPIMLYERSTVSFNSHQPSLNPVDANSPVEQWISIVNMGEDAAQYTINTYNQQGTKIDTNVITLQPRQRRDLLAGDSRTEAELAGGTRAMIGSHEIIPPESNLYFAQLVRYGRKAEQDSYAFAIPLLFVQEFDGLAVSVSRGARADNYLEIINTTETEQTFYLYFLLNSGARAGDRQYHVGPYGQVHVGANAFLPEGASGYVIIGLEDLDPSDNSISKKERATFITQSISYYYDNTGRIKAVSATQGTAPLDYSLNTSYNLYLNSENWLRIYNAFSEESEVRIRVASANGEIVEQNLVLGAFAGIDLPLHDANLYHTAPNTYGAITIDGRVLGEMLRLGGIRAGNMDFVISTPIGNFSGVR